ncbi:DUF116 domain-containing protein [Terrisporobacter glycolicus]|uniref:DUF116 domain-containing protein n=1 Tax=Terrisporobacter glycolicus ATCC 14880 = DSM 1288 TaxID=1121315 RepID=A0ABZ2EX72_9FIRM|nr:DUF116 domain-containing protein [Terrisporobacter glycolicus]
MTDTKKYVKVVNVFLINVILGALIIHLFLSKYINILSLVINLMVIGIILLILFSTMITYFILNDKEVNKYLMKINYTIIRCIFPIISNMGKFVGISKDEIRKIFIKINNAYIYSDKYGFNSESLIILIPHCIQNHNCKLKVTNDIENCKKCGICKIKELLQIKEKYNTKVFIATGGTLARKIIIDNKPKAVIAVACERDLTSGVRDVKGIPVLGVFNSRPNGPCIDTNINIKEIEEAINFFTNK